MIHEPKDPPPWYDKEKLISAIICLSPPDIVIENHPMLKACCDPGGLWNRNKLQAFSEWDLVNIFRAAQVTQEQINERMGNGQ